MEKIIYFNIDSGLLSREDNGIYVQNYKGEERLKYLLKNIENSDCPNRDKIEVNILDYKVAKMISFGDIDDIFNLPEGVTIPAFNDQFEAIYIIENDDKNYIIIPNISGIPKYKINEYIKKLLQFLKDSKENIFYLCSANSNTNLNYQFHEINLNNENEYEFNPTAITREELIKIIGCTNDQLKIPQDQCSLVLIK